MKDLLCVWLGLSTPQIGGGLMRISSIWLVLCAVLLHVVCVYWGIRYGLCGTW